MWHVGARHAIAVEDVVVAVISTRAARRVIRHPRAPLESERLGFTAPTARQSCPATADRLGCGWRRWERPRLAATTLPVPRIEWRSR